MSALPRPTRSSSPRNSASPKRRPLHERSDSDTNEIAGSPSPRNSKTEVDFFYSQSPFPRLPSQVLRPAGQPWVFEDSSATPPVPSPPTAPASRIPQWQPKPPRQSRSRSPRNKGKQRAIEELPPLNTSSPPPQPPPRSAARSPLSRGRSSPRSPASSSPRPLERTDSKVRSIVSAIEEASLRSESLPPTPRPISRPRQSPRASPARFNSSTLLADEPVPPLPPLISSIEEDEFPAVQSPVLNSEEPFSALPSSDPPERTPPSPPSHVPADDFDDDASTLPEMAPFRAMRSNETLSSDMQERPRSSSAPGTSTDALLQALIASGANVQYPRLEQPSMASINSDSSSLRRAFPQPLNLKRKPGRSHLARAHSASDLDETEDFVLEYDDRDQPLQMPGPPTTPPREQSLEPSLNWTPGRWTSELEDTVPELNPHALRTQHSFYRGRDSLESRPASVWSVESSSSIGFYRFLNDSKTAWAKSYYSGNGTLRNVTPPYLSTASLGRHPSSTRRRSYSASLSPSGMSQQALSQTAMSRSQSQSLSLSQSQDSDDVPQQLYIPRRRPFQRRPPEMVEMADGSSSREVEMSDDLSITQAEPGQPVIVEQVPSPRRAQFPARGQRKRAHVLQWNQPYDHMGPVPHLSPDRSADPRYSVMRPPSLDGYGWFTPVNVQLGLAILGLICPFSWMVGACLSLPPRPAPPVADIEDGPGAEVSPEVQQAYLEDPEVKQYHKTRFLRRVNRAMSITGVCIIAAVIALAIIATR